MVDTVLEEVVFGMEYHSPQRKLVVNSLPIVGSRTDTSVCYNDLFALIGTGANTYSWDNGITNNIPFNALNTTTYIVTGTDTNSCINYDTVTISVNPLPTVSFDGFTSGSNTGPGLDFAICFEDSLTLNGTGAVSYTWDNGVVDGQYFAPAATADYIVTGNRCEQLCEYRYDDDNCKFITCRLVLEVMLQYVHLILRP